MRIIFNRLYFCELEKMIRIEKKYSEMKKNNSAVKKNTRTFFFCAQYFFLALMPQVSEVVKKVSWVIPCALVGERGVYGNPMTAQVMKHL